MANKIISAKEVAATEAMSIALLIAKSLGQAFANIMANPNNNSQVRMQQRAIQENASLLGGEIFIFGSVARKIIHGQEDELVGDLDLMVIVPDFLANSFRPVRKNKRHRVTTQHQLENDDWYLNLDSNLWFLAGKLGIECSAIALADSIDAHILPLSFFSNPAKREELLAYHRDQNFFRNAFMDVLRFNFLRGEFKPVTVAQIERNYRTSLPDLLPQ